MSEQLNIAEHEEKQPTSLATNTATEKSQQETTSSAPKWLPEGVREIWQQVGNSVTRMRNGAIMATPAVIVNNASNILGASHVATEMLMFKSGMKDNKLIDDSSKPINWIKQPAKKIYADIVTKGESRDYSLRQLFRGNFASNFHTYVSDAHAASHRELDRQISANREATSKGKANKPLSFGNPWQTRSTAAGIVIWLLSTIIPERKESDEEIERMAKMRTLHPFQYIGTRLKQAIWIPEWMTHKREMLGLGYLTIGVLSGFGSWRNRGDLAPDLKLTKNMPAAQVEAKLRGYTANIRAAEREGQIIAKSVLKNVSLIEKALKEGHNLTQGYKFNAGYLATAVVSFLAGLPLLFALDERKAYSSYGSLSLLRIPALPSSLYSKIVNKESGWQYYTGGKLLFQFEDFIFSLIGGATKKVHPDGTVEIVDHEKLKKQAIAQAKQEKGAKRQVDSGHDKLLADGAGLQELVGGPTPTITQASLLERAMPERVAQVGNKHGEAAANDSSMLVAANSR